MILWQINIMGLVIFADFLQETVMVNLFTRMTLCPQKLRLFILCDDD